MNITILELKPPTDFDQFGLDPYYVALISQFQSISLYFASHFTPVNIHVKCNCFITACLLGFLCYHNDEAEIIGSQGHIVQLIDVHQEQKVLENLISRDRAARPI